MKQKWMHVISIWVAFLRRTWVCVVPGRRCFCLACWFLNEMSPLFMCTSANKDLCLCANPEEVNHATISVCIAFFTQLLTDPGIPLITYIDLLATISNEEIPVTLVIATVYPIIASSCSSVKTINNRKSIWKITFFLSRISFFTNL